MTIATQTPQDNHGPRHYGFAIGLMAGTCVGAGLMMWLAPGAASEIRKRMQASARSLGDRTSEQYRYASAHIGAAVSAVTSKGQDVRDEVAESVARGAHEVALGAQAVERAAVSFASR